MDRSACFDETGVYRYRLDRRWGENRLHNICFLMLNPSTADAFQEDPTIRRCISFAKREGFPSMTVVNLFGLRATDPGELQHHMDPIGEHNDYYVYGAAMDSDLVVCAWGVHGALRNRSSEIAEVLRDAESQGKLRCLGVTKAGHPKHPLYLHTETPMIPFGAKRGQ